MSEKKPKAVETAAVHTINGKRVLTVPVNIRGFTGMTNDDAAKATFLAGLPTGDKGELIPGHTEWDDLGPKAKERYRRMAAAARRQP